MSLRALIITASALLVNSSLSPLSCQAAAESGKMGSITADLLQMIWSLLLVIALILLLYAILRKKLSITGCQSGKAITIVEIRPLPGKKSLCLVEVENKKLLLGVAEGGINLLATLPNAKSFDSTLDDYRHSAAATPPAEETTP